jgi:excisionase family DNA binding protein
VPHIPSQPNVPRLLTIKEAADCLGIHPRTMQRIVAEGRIGTSRPTPRRVMIPEADLAEYIAARSARATA